MATVQFVQFTKHEEHSYGYTPELSRLYKVVRLEDEYEIEDEDNGDVTYLQSMVIRTGTGMRRDGSDYPINNYVILEDTDSEYNLITIELDDDSQLFK